MKKKRKPIGEPFVAMPLALLKGFIWREGLSHGEKSVYLDMRREWSCSTKGDYDRAFQCPYEAIDASAETISKALKRFQRFGLIEIPQDARGGLYGGATRYFMSLKWKHYKPTEEEKQRFDETYYRKAKKMLRSRERRIQRLRDWERGTDKKQLRLPKRGASPTEGKATGRGGNTASPTEAEEEGETDGKPLQHKA